MVDIFNTLKPGGILVFSTPYYFYKPISTSDQGPFSEEETGGHVRWGYTKSMLKELCLVSGFQIEEISGCSGYFSQKITKIYRALFEISPLLAWIVILPLRILPVLLDKPIKHLFGPVDYSICMLAVKPRFHNGSWQRFLKRNTYFSDKCSMVSEIKIVVWNKILTWNFLSYHGLNFFLPI